MVPTEQAAIISGLQAKVRELEAAKAEALALIPVKGPTWGEVARGLIPFGGGRERVDAVRCVLMIGSALMMETEGRTGLRIR